jgi:hypothetical protein
MVTVRNVAGRVERPERLRKKAVVQIELVIDDRPFVAAMSPSDRRIALQHDAIEIAQLGHVVIAVGLVQQ